MSFIILNELVQPSNKTIPTFPEEKQKPKAKKKRNLLDALKHNPFT